MQFWAGSVAAAVADKNEFGQNFDLIADGGTEKYDFQIIFAMNSDKRYGPSGAH